MTYHEYGLACDDCSCAIGSGDLSGVDDARATEIRRGLEKAPVYLVLSKPQGFVWRACDVCGAPAGNRWEIGYLE